MLNFENLNKSQDIGLITEGKYQIPCIKPQPLAKVEKYIPFNYALSNPIGENRGVHFFVDDYQFQRLWNQPSRYLPIHKLQEITVLSGTGTKGNGENNIVY